MNYILPNPDAVLPIVLPLILLPILLPLLSIVDPAIDDRFESIALIALAPASIEDCPTELSSFDLPI